MPPDARETSPSCSAWDNSRCEGTRFCQPRCPRVFDDAGRPLVVRRLADGDVERLLDMYEEMSGETYTLGLPPRTRERTADWLGGLDVDGLNLVAVDDGRAVGHVAAAPLDDPAPELVVFVRPGHRDRGLGTELLRQLVAYAADSGCESLLLTVDGDNERAVHVYDNLGFDVVERLREELTMELVLDGPLVERAQAPPAERPDGA